MKRDLEYLREILLTIESAGPKDRPTCQNFMPEKDNMDDFIKASFHISLLLDNNFIELEHEPIFVPGCIWKDYRIQRLTSQGCDYLDTIRNNEVWSGIKSKMGTLLESASLSTITSVGQALIKSQLGI